MNKITKSWVVVGMMLVCGWAWATDPPTMTHSVGVRNVTASWENPTRLVVRWDVLVDAQTQDPGIMASNPSAAGLSYAFTMSIRTAGGQIVQVATLPETHQMNGCMPLSCPGLTQGCGYACGDGLGVFLEGQCVQNEFDEGAAQPCGWNCCKRGSGSCDVAIGAGTDHQCFVQGDVGYVYHCDLCKTLGVREQKLELGVAGAAAVRGGIAQININALNFVDIGSDNNMGQAGIPQ